MTGAHSSKTAHAPPHRLTEDKDGSIRITANNVGAIGKLDPNSGAVAGYPFSGVKRRKASASP